MPAAEGLDLSAACIANTGAARGKINDLPLSPGPLLVCFTRNGKAYVALIDARRLDYYQRLERETIHLTLLDEATRGWDDVEANELLSVAELKARYGRRP